MRRIFSRIAALNPLRWMMLLIAIAVMVRLAWSVALGPRQPRFDEGSYIAMAVNLADGNGYVNVGRGPAYWPPGYPSVLAASYVIFGRGPLTNILLQIALGTATCVLVSLVGTAAFGQRVGRLAALFLALYPTHVFYATLFLTEPLFALLFLGLVALLVQGAVKGTARSAGSGVAIGLAALVRPVILLLPMALPVWYWSQGSRRGTSLARALLVLLCALTVVSPWLMRNHAFTGRWTTISTSGGHNFWMGNYPGAFGGIAYRGSIMEHLRDGSEVDYSRGYRLGLAAISASPGHAAVRVLQKISYFFALETDGVIWNLKGLAQPPPIAVTLVLLAAANVAYLFVLSFSVLGLLCTPLKNPLASLFLVATGYFVVMAIVFLGDPRYHYGLVPIAVIFAAKGLIVDWPVLSKTVKAKDSTGRRKLVTWGAILLVFFVLIAANLGLKVLEFRALRT